MQAVFTSDNASDIVTISVTDYSVATILGCYPINDHAVRVEPDPSDRVGCRFYIT